MSENAIQPRDPAIGQIVLGRYRVVGQLARGGMGAIYLGRNEGSAGFVRPVVIKRSLHAQNDKAAALFAREARILSALRHPGIVSVLEFAEEEGAHVMVLDYVHGFNLRQWYRYARRRRGRMDLDYALYAMTQTLDALDYAHTLRGPGGAPLDIVHRDVKPSNVLIDIEGHVQLSDFGIARTSTDATDMNSTDATLRGTFSYMAPELFKRAPASPCTDVYSAAATLRELIVGNNEFQTDDLMSTVAKVMNFRPRPMREVRDDVSPALDDLMAHALAKDPDARPQTAEEFARELRDVWRPPDDIAERFAAAVRRDFTDPELAKLHGTAPLEARERAWREHRGSADQETEIVELPLLEAATATVTSRATPFPQSGDTVATRPGSLAARRRRRSRWPAVATIAAALGAAAVAAVVMLRGDDDRRPPKTVVMVRGDVRPDTAADTAAPAPAGDLTGAFRARQELVARCIQRHEPDPSSLPAISIRFQIDAGGDVTRATLDPAALADQPLGECILRVARATAFPPQAGPVTFRIPLSFKK